VPEPIAPPSVEKPVAVTEKAPLPVPPPVVEPKAEPVSKAPIHPVEALDFSHIANPIHIVEASVTLPKPVPHREPTQAFVVPTYDPYEPPPVSALDGFVFDDLPAEGQEVLEAIAHVETTNNAEAESQVLDALEAVSQRFQSAVTPENPHDETVE
jgi:hypothetical protein